MEKDLLENAATGGGGDNISWGITTVTQSADKTYVNIPHNMGSQPTFLAMFAIPYSSTAPDMSAGGIVGVAYQTVATTLSSAVNYAFYLYFDTSGVLKAKRASIGNNTTYVQRSTTTDIVKNGDIGVNFISAPAAVRYVWIAVSGE